jgi:hypothetical protein
MSSSYEKGIDISGFDLYISGVRNISYARFQQWLQTIDGRGTETDLLCEFGGGNP